MCAQGNIYRVSGHSALQICHMRVSRYITFVTISHLMRGVLYQVNGLSDFGGKKCAFITDECINVYCHKTYLDLR